MNWKMVALVWASQEHIHIHTVEDRQKSYLKKKRKENFSYNLKFGFSADQLDRLYPAYLEVYSVQ